MSAATSSIQRIDPATLKALAEEIRFRGVQEGRERQVSDVYLAGKFIAGHVYWTEPMWGKGGYLSRYLGGDTREPESRNVYTPTSAVSTDPAQVQEWLDAVAGAGYTATKTACCYEDNTWYLDCPDAESCLAIELGLSGQDPVAALAEAIAYNLPHDEEE